MFRKAVRTHVLKKPENPLGALLQETIQKQRDEIRHALMKFTYFHKWPEDKIHQCCVHSNIITYNENDIIRVKDDANVDVTHFILNGKVSVVQRILVLKYRKKTDSKNKFHYKLSKRQDLNVKNFPKIEPVYMQVCHLLAGATFGLGNKLRHSHGKTCEELCKHVIIASKQTRCLLVPRHIILQHYSLDNIWQKIILFLNTVYPSTEEIFEQFLLGRKWREYSEDLYTFKAEKSVPTGLSLHDVPLTCRTQEPRLCQAYPQAKRHPLYLIGERKLSIPFLDIVGEDTSLAVGDKGKERPNHLEQNA